MEGAHSRRGQPGCRVAAQNPKLVVYNSGACRPVSAVYRAALFTGSWYNSSNGGTAFGTPWTLNAQGTGGGPKIEWPKNRLSAGSLPCVWCGCRREGTLSRHVSSSKIRMIAQRVSVDEPSLVALGGGVISFWAAPKK